MAIEYTDLSEVATQTSADTVNFYAEKSDDEYAFAKVPKSEIIAEFLAQVGMPQMYIVGGQIAKNDNNSIILNTNLYCKDETGAVDLTLASGFIKYINSNFAQGSGGGGLDINTVGRQKYKVYVIGKTDLTAFDLLFVALESTPTMPAGWSYKRHFGYVYASTSIQRVYQKEDIKYNHLFNSLPKDYISDFTIIKDSDTEIIISSLELKDENNAIDMCSVGNFFKSITDNFDETNGFLDTGAIADYTQYYIYAIYNPTIGRTNFLMSLSSTAPTMPTDYTYKKIIGFLKTDFYSSTFEFYCYPITQAWDDINFDIASIAKSTSIETDAPSYEDAFGNGIKVACFADGSVQQISAGKEYPHSGVLVFFIQFHFHGYPVTNHVGNALLFVDYFYTQNGIVVPNSATRLTKLFTTSGVVGQEVDVNFDLSPGICPKTGATLQQGTQIWFKFGRIGNDPTDTYTGKLAIRTFGFHFLNKEKNGSDMISTNL